MDEVEGYRNGVYLSLPFACCEETGAVVPAESGDESEGRCFGLSGPCAL